MSNPQPNIVYDAQLEIIFIDYSGFTLTQAIMAQVLTEVIALSATLPRKVYVASCLKDTKFDPALNEEWGMLTTELLRYVRGVIRYGVSNAYAHITIRTSTVKNRLQGIQSHIYPTREEAIRAIRQLEQSPDKSGS